MISYESISAGTIVFGLLVPGFLFLISVAMMIGCVVDLWKVSVRRKWPTANGVVISSEVLTPHKRGCRPFIRYSFSVGGQQFQSTNFFHGQQSRGYSRTKADRIISQYPPGTAITVHYNGRNPFDSVVVVKTIAWTLLLAAAIFAVAGLGSAALAWLIELVARR